ncbi:MAG: thioesterase family protein [Anaerolineales bacterium]|jgi:acyl-CoA thioester hydrolase
MKDYAFRLDFSVRDYECDLAGMVNNATYLNYLEHARHEFLKSRGVDFAALAQKGIYLVVIRIEVDYLYTLRSGEHFYVALNPERVSRLRFGFQQDIFRLPDERAVVKARVIGAAINEKGRPILPSEIEQLLNERQS